MAGLKITAMTARSTSPDSATSPVLLRGDIDGIALLSLNRPQARNTLSEAMLAALHGEFAAIASDDAGSRRHHLAQRPGVLRRARHEGNDRASQRSRSRPRLFQDADGALQRADESIQNLPQPVIAAVEGVATAAGCQLVATCDLAVASETAQFSTPGVHIGLFCSTPMVALSRNVANKHAMEMLLTGDMVSADDAYRIGLINRVVAAGQASEHALELARQIASKSTLTVKIGKQAFYRQREIDLAGAYKLTHRRHGREHAGA